MTNKDIQNFLEKSNYDLRITGDARWIDQKCTPDVVCFIADCVLCFFDNNKTLTSTFVVNDIWNSVYFNENVKAVFGKPDAQNETASHEYDKFIQQPLKMLSYSKVLICEKKGATNHFTINNYDLLNYIASKERNAYHFLYEYIVKVLKDSNLLIYFETFKNLCKNKKASSSDFNSLKTKYEDFFLKYTPINQRVEIRRIFTKVLNPYSVENQILGTIRGHISKEIITYSELMYNRLNWRDIDKAKGLTRQEFESAIIEYDAEDYNKYLLQKAMSQIRRKYLVSELKDEWANDTATEVHHIFMKHEFPQIAAYLENLIKLTPNQHRNHAHPNSNFHVVNKDYQYICLLAKSNSIEISLQNNEEFYSTENFVIVINTGLKENLPITTNLNQIRKYLAQQYQIN